MAKEQEKPKEKECPFRKDLKCEDCRLYQTFIKEVGKTCPITFSAIRSI